MSRSALPWLSAISAEPGASATAWRLCSAAAAGVSGVAPRGATFEDGYRCAVVCDAILTSARTGRRVDIAY